MALGKKKDPEEPKAPKEKKPKKEKPPKKPKPAKKEKPPKKGKAPKKPKKGQKAPQEGEELEEGKKKPPIILILIPIAVIAIAAAVFFIFIFPNLGGSPDDPDVIESEEPKPPELPEELLVGEISVSVPGLTLEADESEAQAAVIGRTVTYTYTNLNDAGAAAETYVGQLTAASPRFYVVDNDFVRTDPPDFTTEEGEVLLARDLSKEELEAEFGIKEEEEEEVEETPAPTDPPEDESGEPEDSSPLVTLIPLLPLAPVESPDPVETPAPTETPEPEEPVEEEKTPSYVAAVRITWSEGRCVVVTGEEEGKVTSPPPSTPGVSPSIGVYDAEEQLLSMTPAELGLPGTSMAAEYEVFAWNETELVNGVTCIRLEVYNSSDGPNPNLYAGSYLMSVDGAHLYRLNTATDEVRELDFTLNVS